MTISKAHLLAALSNTLTHNTTDGATKSLLTVSLINTDAAAPSSTPKPVDTYQSRQRKKKLAKRKKKLRQRNKG